MCKHFKKELILDVFKIIKTDVWMASVDLKDAFFTIPINEAYQKYFMFEWLEKIYKFIAMPNGFSDAMHVFTKVSKPVYAYLGQHGYMSVIFVDDSYLQGDTKQECLQNIEATVSLLESLGFAIHEGKSILNPTQEIEFLGFVFNSVTMTISITKGKTEAIILEIRRFLENKSPTIRELASVIGSVILRFPAIPFGKLHYKALEKDKTNALKKVAGHFDKQISQISYKASTELHWWLNEIPKACTNIHLPKVNFVIHTDASQAGCGATNGNNPTGERWLENQENHINYLELKAVFLAVRAYQRYWRGNRHIQIKSDNTTAITYVNNMGGIVSEKYNDLSKQIWDLRIMDITCPYSWQTICSSRIYV